MDTSNSVFLEINATSTVVVKKELLWPITPLKESLRAHCAGFDRSLYSEETQALLDSILGDGLNRQRCRGGSGAISGKARRNPHSDGGGRAGAGL